MVLPRRCYMDFLIRHSAVVIHTDPTALLIVISMTHPIVRTSTRVLCRYIVPRDSDLIVVFIHCLRVFRLVLVHLLRLLHYLYLDWIFLGFHGVQFGMDVGEKARWLWTCAVDSFANANIEVESTKSEEDTIACDRGNGWC